MKGFLILMEDITNTIQEELTTRTWNYSEKNNKHVTYHTITVNKKRFTHEAEVKEAAQAMRQRTDISLNNISAVSTYFGLSRNIVAVVLCVIFAVLSLVLGIVGFSKDVAVLGVIGLILFIGLLIIAYFVYKMIKPAFVLELETYIPQSTLRKHSLSYGNASVDFSKKKHSPVFYVFLVVFFPAGIIYLLTRGNKNKYKFVMDPEVGNNIVDTIGPLLMD